MSIEWIIGVAVLGIVMGIFVVVVRKPYRRRELVEDALKYLNTCEYNNIPGSLDSLAGALALQRDRTAEILEILTERRLVTLTGSVVSLTPEGREYALRVIRVHRLWERHLSDETMVHEVDWHKQAEQKEHVLDRQEVLELSRRLGHPVYDPHGDPIPTAGGALPAQKGEPIQSFDIGTALTITHVEDEPSSIYAQLVSLKLYHGMTIRIVEATEEKVILEREGELIELPPVLAANLRGEIEPAAEDTGPRKTLASLQPGEQGVVGGISPVCRGLQRRRLMDLGIVPGTTIEVTLKSATGDPTAYRIRGGTIALRKQQAKMIFLQ